MTLQDIYVMRRILEEVWFSLTTAALFVVVGVVGGFVAGTILKGKS